MVQRFLRAISNPLRQKKEVEAEKTPELQSQTEAEQVTTSPVEQKTPQHDSQVVVDASTRKIIGESPPNPKVVESEQRALELPPHISSRLPNHPIDVVKLAAMNEAFFNGLLALQKLNLDEDLYWKAVEDLRRNYETERGRYIKSQ